MMNIPACSDIARHAAADLVVLQGLAFSPRLSQPDDNF